MAKKKITSSFAVLGQYYPPYINTQRRQTHAYYDGVMLLLVLLILFTLTFLYPQIMLLAYWLPLFVAYSGIMFFAIPEHNGCKSIAGYYSLARSFFTNGLVRFFLWNGNFHAEHHIHPGALPYLLKEICEQEKNYIWYREQSYLKWHYRLVKQLVVQHRAEEKQICQK